MTPSLRGRALGIALVVVALSLPFWLIQTNMVLSIMTLAFIYMTASLAWNLLGGFGGQISFGHSIFFGLGAYLPALLFSRFGVNVYIGIIAGVVAAVVVALPLGLLTLRIRGIYFALATFTVTLVFQTLSTHFDGVTGGDVGVALPVRAGAGQFQFEDKLNYYYIAVLVAAGAALINVRVRRSRLGLRLRSVRDDEDAAKANGVRAFRVKVVTLTLSAAVTSLAGSLYVAYVGFIDPTSAFGMTVATQIAVLAIAGGAGTVAGPILGALVLVPLQQTLGTSFASWPSGLGLMVYAVVIMAVLWLEPRGLIALVDTVKRAVTRGRRGAGGTPAVPDGPAELAREVSRR